MTDKYKEIRYKYLMVLLYIDLYKMYQTFDRYIDILKLKLCHKVIFVSNFLFV